jgi:hypothetical protein
MKRISALALLVAVVPAWAEPPKLVVPAELKPAGDYATFAPSTADTTAKAVTYVGLSGVEPFPSAFLKDSRAFVLPVRGLAAGRYKFRAVGSLNDEHATADFVVVVGDAPPPVDPIGPDKPLTPFQAKLQAAVKADGAPAEAVRKYAALYKLAAATTVRDASLLTTGGLLTEMRQAVKSLGLPAGSLDKTARVVADELNAVLPTAANATLDTATRDKIAVAFLAVAAALEGVAK